MSTRTRGKDIARAFKAASAASEESHFGPKDAIFGFSLLCPCTAQGSLRHAQACSGSAQVRVAACSAWQLEGGRKRSCGSPLYRCISIKSFTPNTERAESSLPISMLAYPDQAEKKKATQRITDARQFDISSHNETR